MVNYFLSIAQTKYGGLYQTISSTIQYFFYSYQWRFLINSGVTGLEVAIFVLAHACEDFMFLKKLQFLAKKRLFIAFSYSSSPVNNLIISLCCVALEHH